MSPTAAGPPSPQGADAVRPGYRSLGGREHLVMLLAVVSGSVDAIGFVALGGAFTSVMTGNLVLTGVSLAHGDGRLLLRVVAAITCYVLGCWAGARLSGKMPSAGTGAREQWPRDVTRALLAELGLIAVFAASWWATADNPSTNAELAMLAVNAAALGMQSAAVLRFGVPGLSTTYFTGTLTTLVVRLGHRQPLGEQWLNAGLLAAVIAGGASGSALALYARPAAPVLPLVCLSLAVVGGRRLQQAGAQSGGD